MEPDLWALGGIAVLAAVTFTLAARGAGSARTTSDFLAARRTVGVERNATAISGEYLSAASFLGVAGLVLKDGVQALWYPIGFTAGYLVLMLFVAAPLRRSGAYTLPDFVQARLDSYRLRQLATVLVVLIGWLYLVPQLQAAGLTLSTITDMPYWSGIVVVAVLVLLGVLGGMRAATLVQAFQYWVKLCAITVPAFVLCLVFLDGDSQHRRGLDEAVPPVFERDTTVRLSIDVRLQVTEPVWLRVEGGTGAGVLGDDPAPGPSSVYVSPGEYPVSAGTELRFPAGAPVPVVDDAVAENRSWLLPQDDGARGLFETYSLILATFLGTMGLPHVLVRFYTNPSGHAARRTTLFVLALLGAFYLFPTVFGLLSRFHAPQLLVTGRTDAAVLQLPGAMLGNWAGGLLGAITAAGAFAAFLATSGGLVMSVVGVLSDDVLPGRTWDVRLISLGAAAIPAALALSAMGRDIAQSVGLAFAMAASTFFPLLVLGVWWRRLTAAGAAAGLLTGGSLVLAAVVLGMFVADTQSWWATVLQQPAAITVPIAFLVTFVVSRATRHRVPPGTARVMLRMHAPDRLGFVHDRLESSGGEGGQPHARGRHHR
ncbi:sodium:solute symporter family protein [Halopolyspora algeriensis]|uniref:Sodium:solute symporter family protein n=1 Tax=Halopolyspora algeriensis TaxID=1500506 RepID=A0A368VYJ6_9ACTN|nr:cation acetate symporter [Halopolyspora algeriensis]RCW47288.1 sodium:solute symporter family protein [Halopolyspora algeriensis]TQM42523.1 sodium:solute symporter family protein [Halopolyspora algeriensis]